MDALSLNYFLDLLDLLWKSLGTLIVSFFDGMYFFCVTITKIPFLIFDLINELPGVFQVGLYGIFGLLLLTVFLKLVAMVKLNG